MESSKPTAKHKKQVLINPQAAQIHLMHHQCTELPPSKFRRKQKKPFKSRQDTNKQYNNEEKQRERVPQSHKKYDNYQTHASQERIQNVVIHNILRDSDVQSASTNVKLVTSMVILVACATRRGILNIKGLLNPDHPKHINFTLVQFAFKIPYVASQKRALAKIYSACKYN